MQEALPIKEKDFGKVLLISNMTLEKKLAKESEE